MQWLIDGVTDGRGLVTNLAATAIWAIGAALIYACFRLYKRVRIWMREYKETHLWVARRVSTLASITAGTTIDTHAIAYAELILRRLERLVDDVRMLAVYSLLLASIFSHWAAIFFAGMGICAMFVSNLLDKKLISLQEAFREGLLESIFPKKTGAEQIPAGEEGNAKS